MKRVVVPLVLYALFVCSALYVYVYGTCGVRRLGELDEHAELLQDNIQQLEATNAELNRRLRSLSEADAVRLLARELNYLAAGETAITIDSYAPKRSFYEVGRLIIMREARASVALRQTLFLVPLVLLLGYFVVVSRAT